MEKKDKNKLMPATTYVTEDTKKKWIAHIKKTKPKYSSISHFLEDAAAYKIKADEVYSGMGLLKK
ncbi:unnamed protein product [marine sediment metagenome]|uniref:Uncharacterized protein n=1 Tax=marine sediment metagenome TaxID=412755 RepID=X1BDV5_9ZZZZ